MASASSYTTSRAGRVALPYGTDPAWIDARFERAVDIIQSLPRNGPIQTNYDDKLLLYSVYKQATEGDVKTSRPGMLDILGRAKWDAWNKKKGVSEDDAKRHYVEGLVKILRGFSDRPLAVELIRELENFSLEPSRGQSGSIVGSESSGSSSATPPPPASHSRSSLPPPASSSRRHIPTAPSLPGYGPPRTTADSVRAAPPSTSRHRTRQPQDRSSQSSHSSSEDDHAPRQFDTPPTSQAGQRRPATMPNRVLSPPLPIPSSHLRQSFHSFSPQQQPVGNYAYPVNRGDTFPVNRGGLTPSPGPPGPGRGGMTAVQYPAGFRPLSAQQLQNLQYQPPQQQQALQHPLYNQQAFPIPALHVPVQQPPPLDAALDRLQTSLTALHERLTSLETLNISPSPSFSTLLLALFYKALFALRLRSTPPSTGLSLAKTLKLLFLSVVRGGRNAVGDMGVVLVLGVLVARWSGRGDVVASLLARALGVGTG
ncbi:hypothetical protein P7C70_g7383, partial [Phenoliferia sp. Uapishka_3]